ncbi:MAG: putative oxidoreductase [Pseudomonadota bacterium]|jgi:oxygen-independent coproporphyrinogen-3 oxidase
MSRIIPILPQQTVSPREGSGLSVLPPLSLYVHIPWCVKKCPYCDFNSHEARGALPEEAYVAALIRDLELALPGIWGRRVISIFFGGGTPSVFSAKSIETLLDAIRARLNLLPDAEITLEANPGTVEADKFAAFRQAGVNRLSLGIQSFNERHLKALGRIHDGTQARRAIESALKHFSRINLDLMYALPEQSLNEAMEDITTAIAFGTAHISAYHLTLEPNTRFYHDPPPVPEADLAADMQEGVEAKLIEAGFEHYETSAFAKPGERCRHNLNYWTFGDYLGIGAGAHSKLSSAQSMIREMRYKHPQTYLDQVTASAPVQSKEAIDQASLPFEFMMNALRLAEGFDASLFKARTGMPLSYIDAPLARAVERGLLEVSPERIRPTSRGRHFLNDLLQIFM